MTAIDWTLLQQAVCETFDITRGRLDSRLRTRECVDARGACILLVRNQFPRLTDRDLARISGRQRSAICHLRLRAYDWFEVDAAYRRKTQLAMRRFVELRRDFLAQKGAAA